jgi:hypothetical protein
VRLWDEKLRATTSPGFLLYILSPVEISDTLQIAQLSTLVSMKVNLKLVEFPKNLGFPSPLKVKSINPEGLVIVSTCKLNTLVL